MDVSLTDLLRQQAKNNPERTYIRGYFGKVSYGKTLRQARELGQFLALSSRIAGSGSVGICTESPDYIVYTLWATIFVDISLVFLPLCRDPDVMLSAMKEASVEVVHLDLQADAVEESVAPDSSPKRHMQLGLRHKL